MDYPMTKDMTVREYLTNLPEGRVREAWDKFNLTNPTNCGNIWGYEKAVKFLDKIADAFQSASYIRQIPSGMAGAKHINCGELAADVTDNAVYICDSQKLLITIYKGSDRGTDKIIIHTPPNSPPWPVDDTIRSTPLGPTMMYGINMYIPINILSNMLPNNVRLLWWMDMNGPYTAQDKPREYGFMCGVENRIYNTPRRIIFNNVNTKGGKNTYNCAGYEPFKLAKLNRQKARSALINTRYNEFVAWVETIRRLGVDVLQYDRLDALPMKSGDIMDALQGGLESGGWRILAINTWKIKNYHLHIKHSIYKHKNCYDTYEQEWLDATDFMNSARNMWLFNMMNEEQIATSHIPILERCLAQDSDPLGKDQ